MATPVVAFAQLATECEKEGLSHKNAERIGQELAKQFNVHPDEVGILKLEKQSLIFVYPAKLHMVGTIPLNTAGSVAARTATSKRAEVINAFAQAKHEVVIIAHHGCLDASPPHFQNRLDWQMETPKKGRVSPFQTFPVFREEIVLPRK